MKSLFKSIACILSLAALSAGPLQAQVNFERGLSMILDNARDGADERLGR